jgi:cytochrome b involved in lipid metabolism
MCIIILFLVDDDITAIYLSINVAWISYQGKVYDVSNWEDHPGKFKLR